MCCGGRMCMLCTCLILVAVVIGMLFGFGVFKNAFHKIKDTVHECDPLHFNGTLCAAAAATGRPFLGFPAPPPS